MNTNYNAGARPPLELIPTEIAELLVERDRILVQRQAAEIKVRELSAESLTVEAKAADDQAATKAARAGKPIPKTSGLEKLTTSREEAARERAAQESALAAVTDEISAAMSDAYPWDTIAATRDKTRARLAELANQLADEVEAAVAADAAVEWLRSERYSHNAPRVDPCDVVDLSRLNMNDMNLSDPVRAVLIKTATAPFALQPTQ